MYIPGGGAAPATTAIVSPSTRGGVKLAENGCCNAFPVKKFEGDIDPPILERVDMSR